MKSDYPLKGRTAKMEIEVEEEVAQKLLLMSKYSGFTQSELANTALRRFITNHKDFLPEHEPRTA